LLVLDCFRWSITIIGPLIWRNSSSLALVWHCGLRDCGSGWKKVALGHEPRWPTWRVGGGSDAERHGVDLGLWVGQPGRPAPCKFARNDPFRASQSTAVWTFRQDLWPR
jgi:hypothetical protein